MGNNSRRLRRNLRRKHFRRKDEAAAHNPAVENDHGAYNPGTGAQDNLAGRASLEGLGSIARRMSVDIAEKSAWVVREVVPSLNRNFLSFMPNFGSSPSLRFIPQDDARFSLSGRRLYASAQKVDTWIAENSPLDEYTASALERIAGVPSAVWLRDPACAAQEAMQAARNSKAQNSLYQVVLCNAPTRSEGAQLRGNSPYFNYVRSVARALNRAEGVVVLEPGYLVNVSTKAFHEREFQTGVLSTAVQIIRRYAPTARIYIDAGGPEGLTPAICCMLLKMSGVLMARGFAVNVGSAQSTGSCVAYAQKIRAILGDTVSFVVDTSRNGVGGENERVSKIGETPTTYISTDDDLMKGADALLWISNPGEREHIVGNPKAHLNKDNRFCPREAVRLVHDEHTDYAESSRSDDDLLHDAMSHK